MKSYGFVPAQYICRGYRIDTESVTGKKYETAEESFPLRRMIAEKWSEEVPGTEEIVKYINHAKNVVEGSNGGGF